VRKAFIQDYPAGTAVLIWVFTGVFFAFVAESFCLIICPESKGSGIAEMKSILSGAILTRFLSVKALIAKFFGLILAIGGGLSFGKEGPMVHISAIVAHQISKTVVFQSIVKDPGMRRQLLSAAVAAGVTSVFGAPLGGALFSIEVTATYFSVSSLWKTFWCATMTYFWSSAFHSFNLIELFDRTELPRFEFNLQVLLFVLLGVICGIMCALFSYTAASIMLFLKTKTRFSYLYAGNFKTVAIVSGIAALVTYKLLPYPDEDIVNPMFRKEELGEDWKSPHWSLNIIGYIIYKFSFTSLALSMPIPAGVYTPIFATGSLIGRLFGELWKFAIPSIVPGTYALAAAAGFTAGCTRTIATGVIVLELVGQLEPLLPVLITVLVSYSVAKSLSVSVYDLSLRVKALPFIPLLEITSYKKNAEDVMNSKLHFLTYRSTYQDAEQVLKDSRNFYIPIVKSAEDPLLLASIPRSKIVSLVEQRKRNFGVGNDRDSIINVHRRSNSFASRVPVLEDETPRGDNKAYDFRRIDDEKEEPKKLELKNLSFKPEEDEAGAEKTVNSEAKFSEELSTYMSVRIDFSKLVSNIDEAPFCIYPQTPLPKVHYLFTMLGLGQAFVISAGKLVGTINLYDLTDSTTSSHAVFEFNVKS
jgi:chloride channel 2